MRICSTCGYELDAFDERCPRCQRNKSQPAATAAPKVVTPMNAKVSVTTKVPVAKAKVPVVQKQMMASQLGLAGALAAIASFIVPATFFAGFSLGASDGSHATFDIAVLVIFALLVGGLGGFIATAQARFWLGAAAGAAFAVVWSLLCFWFGSLNSGMLAMFAALLLYEGGAIYGAMRRVDSNLPPVNGGLVLSIVTFSFCFFFAVPGIAVTALLTNSDSDYSRPALIGTVLGLSLWTLAFVARMARVGH